jgi:hypothetical protein
MLIASGPIAKMNTTHELPVQYHLPIGNELVAMNRFLGHQLTLHMTGEISCRGCGKSTKKSFQQGFCYPCSIRLACCDICVVKPEMCHYDKGTCREPSWGEAHCMIDHTVYLANSSGIKVGITRAYQQTTRWMDQGATQALPIRRVSTRLESGLVETRFKNVVADKTDWRKMLKGNAEPMDLPALRDSLLAQIQTMFPDSKLPGTPIPDANVVTIEYPVNKFPTKVTAHSFEKNPKLQGTLCGIKGQYLIFDHAVVNIRKYGGYHMSLETSEGKDVSEPKPFAQQALFLGLV